MSDFKRLTAKECALRLLDICDPVILIHTHPDGDAVGTGAALCELFRLLGKSPALFPEAEIPERLRFITEHTGAAMAKTCEGRCAVSVDVASPSQLGAREELIPSVVLMIDHHAHGEQFADGYIAPDASSAAEALVDIACELEWAGKFNLTEKFAYAAYAAISSDTGCFSYSNATPKTHRLAARLMEYGIDAADINRRLFDSKSEEQIKAEGFTASRLETAFGGKAAYALITAADRKALGLLPEHFDTAIDVVRSLCGAQIAFVIKEGDAEGEFKVSLRSVGPDVARVACAFGGGGHIRAAGCTIRAGSAKEVCTLLLHEAEKYI